MHEPLRILHVITGLNLGGAETWLSRLLPAMDRGRFVNQAVSLLAEGPLAQPLVQAGVPVTCLDLARGSVSPRALLRLAGIIRQTRPHIVQTWLYHADLAGLAASWLAPGKRVLAWNIRCSNMDMTRYRRSSSLTLRLCALLSRFPDAVVSNSHAAVDYHRDQGYRPRRFAVLPNGVDTAVFRPDPVARQTLRREWKFPNSAVVMGMVGRFDPQKDHETFCRAAGLAVAQEPRLRYVLCGKGCDKGNIELLSWLQESGASDRTVLLGERSDPHRVMAALDAGVLSSAYGEGFPNVVAETMAAGAPMAVTDVGDAAHIVGETGAVIPPGDHNALGIAMARLAALPVKELAELSRRARERVENEFSLPAAVTRYQEFYEELSQRS